MMFRYTVEVKEEHRVVVRDSLDKTTQYQSLLFFLFSRSLFAFV